MFTEVLDFYIKRNLKTSPITDFRPRVKFPRNLNNY